MRQKSACNAEKWFFMGKLFYLSFFSYASFLCKRFARDEVSYLNLCFLRAWWSLFTMILRTPSFKEILIDLAKVILAQSNGGNIVLEFVNKLRYDSLIRKGGG